MILPIIPIVCSCWYLTSSLLLISANVLDFFRGNPVFFHSPELWEDIKNGPPLPSYQLHFFRFGGRILYHPGRIKK
jgi:hypothetical protein